MALIGTIPATANVVAAAITGTIGSSQIANSAIVRSKLASNQDISGINWYGGEGVQLTDVNLGSSSGRYLIMWPRANDGATFAGQMCFTNYDGPQTIDIHIHNGYPDTLGNLNSAGAWQAAGSTRISSGSLSVRRVLYNSVHYLAIYTSGPTNRDVRFSGLAYRMPSGYPFWVSSVTSDNGTLITI